MTPEQKKAAEYLWSHSEEALQLAAGAGSGKTTTLIEAVKKAAENYCPASEICLITFTRKAAAEMKNRLMKAGVNPAYTGTMHALALRGLQQKSRRKIEILTDTDRVLNEISRRLFSRLSHVPAEMIRVSGLLNEEETAVLNEEYRLYKERNSLADFDDLIRSAAETSVFRKTFRAVFIDEFQDTSPAQLQMVQSFSAEKLFAVGDSRQAIYRFRGADIRNFTSFTEVFRNSRKLDLRFNFRSQKRIVILANKLIKLSRESVSKAQKAVHKAAEKPLFLLNEKNLTPEQAWRRVAGRIPPDSVILVRTNYLKELIEKESAGRRTVITVHSAKGLEFDDVTVFALAEHIFPHRWGDPDEEIRLLYVAVTRAVNRLTLVGWGVDLPAPVERLTSLCRLEYY